MQKAESTYYHYFVDFPTLHYYTHTDGNTHKKHKHLRYL